MVGMSEQPEQEPTPEPPPDVTWMKETEIRKDFGRDPKDDD